jgi:chaperone modulatory protein CbpM
MDEKSMETGVILDDVTLTVYELAHACKVEPDWIVERVQDGTLTTLDGQITSWRFTSAELVRAQRLFATQKTFDATAELAALVVDLIEELERAKRRLKAAGVT